MEPADLNHLLIAVAAVAPYLTGGSNDIQRNRRDMILDSLGQQATLDDATHALRSIVRAGTDRDALSWSRIVNDTLTVTRRRLADDQAPTSDPRIHVTMPEDFHAQVTWHRDRTRREALHRVCPTCRALVDEPCDQAVNPATVNAAGNHHTRQTTT